MRLFIIFFLSLLISTSGCSWIKFPNIHKVDIKQGNIVNQEMIDKLQIGMSKSQVQFVLGTPLITDTFNQRRWDYFYSRAKSNDTKIQEQVTILFDSEGKLIQITGDYVLKTAKPEG